MSNVVPITIIAIIVILIAIGIVVALVYRSRLFACENNQSPYCYAIKCPGGAINTNDPCKGYAQRTDGQGNIICAV